MNDSTFRGFLLRAAFSLLLVLLTFNPSGYSYVHMLTNGFPSVTPVEAVCGILLLIGWIVFLGATLKSIGLIGMVLAFALCGALIWMIVSWGWVTLENTNALVWIGLVVLALILAIGMAWGERGCLFRGDLTSPRTARTPVHGCNGWPTLQGWLLEINHHSATGPTFQ